MQRFNGYGNEGTVNYTQLLLQAVIDMALVPLYDADTCNCGYIKDNKNYALSVGWHRCAMMVEFRYYS